MSKKERIFGDPRRLDLDFFGDVLEKEENKDEITRDELVKLYLSYDVKHPESGKVTSAVYAGISSEDLTFDGGFKDYIRVENKPGENKYLVNTKVGDVVDILITNVDQKNYQINGSIAELYESRARRNLNNLEKGISVLVHVNELTPAGYSVDIFFESVTLPGFMPNTLAGINKLPSPESIIGETFNVMIESFSNDEGTYIVSRRRYLQTLIPQTIKELDYGIVYEGIVTGSTTFGVFVEFKECLTGMIHKTNIDPDWADRLIEIEPGVPIQFYVKEIVKDKIILTQILRESIWDSIKIGQLLEAKVKDHKSFGTLVMLDDETNGLIHTSELEKTNKKLSIGDNVNVRVISVDRMSRKIFLSID